MKKTMTAIGAMFVLLAGVFTSCDFSDFVAPTDQWVYKKNSDGEYSFTYNYNDTELKFDAYINYATRESSVTFSAKTETVKEGVNAILVPKIDPSNESIWKELLSATNLDKICIFYTYGTSATVETSDSDTTGTTQSLSSTIWNAVYLFNNFEKQDNSSFSKLINNYTELNKESITNLNFKRVLYNMLGEKLF